jgi:hypothetical protein
MSETSEVVTPILELLSRVGLTAARMQAGTAHGGKMRLAPAGWPDIIGYLPDGRMFAIECKTAEGKASEEQLAWHRRAKANNVVALFARSQQEVIDRLIAPLGRRAV